MSFRINTNIAAMGALRNLGMNSTMFNKSITRLSTGMRINSAADDPAGLIVSENFRAQISGVGQAIRNNEDAINYAKTAEGALDEIARLLREGRELTVQSGNTALLDANQIQANQNQWDLMVQSVNRIATETQFGKKRLLDGSSGVNASVVNLASIKNISLSGVFDGQSVTANGPIDVNITTAATKATVTGGRTVAAASVAAYLAAPAVAGQFSINGTTFNTSASDTWGDVIARINERSGQTGVVAEAVFAAGNGQLKLTSTTFGTKGNFVVSDSGVIGNAPANLTPTGVNAVATVTIGGTPIVFNGGQMGHDGLTLTDADGNVITLQPTSVAGNVAPAGYVQVGSAQFQTGGNAGQRATLSIGSFLSSTLGIDNLDLTTPNGVNTAMGAIENAISELSRKRGTIGSFMRNVLESNVRSLGIAKENLTATESAIRDVDIADEMTSYTKLQILQQSGLSVLAQANQAPQGVLSLLRG
jgi:flagellin